MAQPIKRKNKKKIAGIVAGSIVAIVLVAAAARPPSTPVAEPLSPPEPGWIRLRIADVGSIDYPPDFLELQSGDYRELVEQLNLVYEIDSSDFALQQVGLNELTPSALAEYRRVMFDTSYLNPGEEVFRATQKYTMTQEELAEIKDDLVSYLSQGFDRLGNTEAGTLRIIDPGTLEIMEVSGMFPLVWTYKRQLDDSPVVVVKDYMFPNYDKIHHLLFAYRVQDEEECEDIFEKILYSFRLQV
jgi:hypothetical protein